MIIILSLSLSLLFFVDEEVFEKLESLWLL